MSELGGPSIPDVPGTTPPSRRRRIALAVTGALLIGAAVGAGVWWTNRGPDHPDEWDARVLPFVKVVEDERGLEFEHPVYVDFLSEKEFKKEVTSEEADLSAEERKEIEQSEGLMRALGFLAGDVDLLDAANDLSSGGVLGLYSYEDKRIRMRGEKLTLAVTSTLVHELTHALQDQHFDLEAKAKRHEKEGDSSAGAAWDAIVEGDADRIESKWAKSLEPAERKKLKRQQARASTNAEGDLKDVPPFLTAMISSSYAFGGSLLELAVALDDEDAVDDLFAKPPTTEEHLLDPWTFLGDHQGAKKVAEPEPAKGGKEFDDGVFGSPTFLFLLAERIDVPTALTAADGWGGDHYVAYEQDDRSCMRVDYVGDTEQDVTELRDALEQWIAGGPEGSASVEEHGEGLRFTSCDPGERAAAGSGGSMKALEIAVARTQIAAQMLSTGAPAPFVQCYADAVVQRFTPEELAGDGTDPAFVTRLQQLAAECR